MYKRLFTLLAVSLFVFTASAQTLRVGLGLGAANVNPGEATGIADATVGRHIFEGLVTIDESGAVVPELASEVVANDDASQFVFTLHEGIEFQDGTPFNAEAVVEYYNWVLDPASTASRGRASLTDIESVTATGDYEVTITLADSNGAFLFNLALNSSRIVSPASLEEYAGNLGRNPVGTGPYVLAGWEDGATLTLERFDGYWGDAPHFENIVFYEVQNAATRVAMLQSGELDFIENVAPQLVPNLEGSRDLVVMSDPGTTGRIFQMNTTKAPFDDVRVRHALNHAVDVDQIINIALRGFGVPLTGPMPSSIFGFKEQTPYEYNPEKAKELLAEAGYADGFTVTMLTFIGDEYHTVGQMLQQYFAEVGVNLIIDAKERGALVDQIFQPVESNVTEAALVGSSSATGDADRTLVVSFAASSFPPTSNNWSFYNNDRVNELLEAGVRTADPAERIEIYGEAQDLIWEEAPWVFIYNATNIAAKRANLEDIFFRPDKTIDARSAHF